MILALQKAGLRILPLMSNEKILIVIAGPTAVGKTDVAISLANHFNTSILSADARQFYREMTIGTAKPSPAQLAAAPHFFIDTIPVAQNYTVADYGKDALQLLNKLFPKKNIAILAGGSGLFVKAVCEGLDKIPPIQKSTRDKWNSLFEEKGLEFLQHELQKHDPVYYETVDKKNPRRLLRALEVFDETGEPFSSFHKNKCTPRNFTPIKIGLELDKAELHQRIDVRVDDMIKNGLVDEVKKLIPYKDSTALKTVGYSELFNYFDQLISLDEAITQIKTHTKQYAKRQITWFKKDKEIKWFKPEEMKEMIEYVNTEIKKR
jgi:tRNA dimethylallyltransferase